jgi:hypothetical protein
MFPYQESKIILTTLLREHLPKNLKNFAEVILDLHLSEEAFIMHFSTTEDDLKIQEMIVRGYSKSDILKSIKFEDTKTKKGMFRVLVRTHLNRSGINHITMGMASNSKKTLSPRILNFTDSIDIEKDSENVILKKWLEFAKDNQKPETPKDLRYDNKAIVSLIALDRYFNNPENPTLPIYGNQNVKRKSAFALSRELNIDIGWCRIVVGVLSGLNYLRFNNWEELYYQSFKKDISYFQIDNLIKDCQSNVCEYGYALAGSFFGDLGSPHFVKDDTHVRDGINSFFTGLNSPEDRVKAVIQSAHSIGVKPRALDKILYIAGSGNLYLLGINLKNPRIIKTKFLERLGQLKSNHDDFLR